MWDCAYVPQFPDCFRLGCTVPAASPEQTFCDGSHKTCGFSQTVEARELAPAKPKLWPSPNGDETVSRVRQILNSPKTVPAEY